MKIVSYNINRYNRAKLAHVLAMGADVYVLPECADKGGVGVVDGYRMEWMGYSDIKGLAVLVRDGIDYEVPEWFNPENRYMLPIIVNKSLLVLASWPTIMPDVKKSYPQILLESLKGYEPYLREYRSIVCGDYNCYIGQGGVSKKTGTFEQCIDFFREMGYSDLYHNMTGEEFGKETNATYYHQFKEDLPFFIDYAFTNMPVKGFVLGDWNKDISDHCPLTIWV